MLSSLSKYIYGTFDFKKIELMNKLIFGVFSVLFAVACFESPTSSENEKSVDSKSEINQESKTNNFTDDHKLQDDEYRFAFYNVENLFDTLDNVDKLDEEFTPLGKKKWTTDRYNKKLNKLASVFEGMSYPSIIGLSEVENRAVLEDLVQKTSLKNHNYEIVHYESPDMRGIDVALLYKKDEFEFKNADKIRINFPNRIVKNYTSRDILYVEGEFNGQLSYFFVNHWPSRYGGQKESEPRRKFVAEVLRKKIDAIQLKNPEASLFIMGDFNDETDNESLTQVLQAKTDATNISKKDLVNCSAAMDQKGKGSYYYYKTKEWNMLDQFIVSASTLNGTSKIQTTEFQVYNAKEVMFYHNKLKTYRPNKTYGGEKYYGGYSDHLAVYLDVQVNQ